MPQEQYHLLAVQKNIKFLNRSEEKVFISKDFPEWSTVVMFYVCVHIIEAALDPHTHCESHQDRWTALLADKARFNLDFRTKYEDLYQLSRRARYLTKKGYSISIPDLEDADGSYQFILTYAKTSFGFTINPNDK